MTSERWAGFTEDDIQEMKLKVSKSCSSENCEVYRDSKDSESQKPMKIKSTVNVKMEDLSSGYANESIDSGWQDTVSEDGLDENSFNQITSVTSSESVSNDLPQNKSSFGDAKIEADGEDSFSTITHPEDEYTIEKTDLKSLEVFEMRQKRIEAENARRRALISKAITDKRKRTQAETMKLAHITQELNKIDSSFSADVAILRDYIEKASQEFSEAEKHYLKVEKEYVNAKIELFKKMQRKEKLTEHLCAIIEQNENRKANKLIELMQQLELDVLPDDLNGVELMANMEELNNEHKSPV